MNDHNALILTVADILMSGDQHPRTPQALLHLPMFRAKDLRVLGGFGWCQPFPAYCHGIDGLSWRGQRIPSKFQLVQYKKLACCTGTSFAYDGDTKTNMTFVKCWWVCHVSYTGKWVLGFSYMDKATPFQNHTLWLLWAHARGRFNRFWVSHCVERMMRLWQQDCLLLWGVTKRYSRGKWRNVLAENYCSCLYRCGFKNLQDILTGAKRREFSGMIHFITSFIIIPATPSNPQQPHQPIHSLRLAAKL